MRERWYSTRWVPARMDPNRYDNRRRFSCDFCWEEIPRDKPGSSRGTRGTKAWYNPARRVYECLGCRSEGFRAEEVRERMDAERRR